MHTLPTRRLSVLKLPACSLNIAVSAALLAALAKSPAVGGAPIDASKTIAENALNAKDSPWWPP